jgi:hypothetical protein
MSLKNRTVKLQTLMSCAIFLAALVGTFIQYGLCQECVYAALLFILGIIASHPETINTEKIDTSVDKVPLSDRHKRFMTQVRVVTYIVLTLFVIGLFSIVNYFIRYPHIYAYVFAAFCLLLGIVLGRKVTIKL